MTEVTPTHQTADGRKFMKVGDLPMKTPDGHFVAWQSMFDGKIHEGIERAIFNGNGLTPLSLIPQPKVRYIGINEKDDYASTLRGQPLPVEGGVNCYNFWIRIEFHPDGTRTFTEENP